MRKETASIVLSLIRERLTTRTDKNRAVTPEEKFLCTLRFYASDSFFINIGELSGLHKSTVSKIINEVSVAIACLCPQFIKMATTEEDIKRVKSGFYSKARFPNCVGAIDCTHVKIQSPGGPQAEVYRNRKGVFTKNVQAICDSTLMFRNIVARWPGNTHDAHIFNSSKVKRDFESNEFGNGVLVGDAGYGCTNYMITPLDSVTTPEEQLFQESQIRTRNPIERCFGVWKRRFPVLSLGIRVKEERVESIIVAAAVLHNVCISENEAVPPVNDEVEAAIAALETLTPQVGRVCQQAPRNVPDQNTIVRNNLINRYFRSLL
ncbi:putative nuclease HARBI1 [Macrosteles quadrilineatus]|uniref:putative nuclease HARBI1 n=1 Tax=Macrosteles quadrilineatus TaxID=74068 RepID=UPI0023E3394B|nr:putative nuclease HARBI1 [Macrosteles quadrilineatus]